MQYMIERRYGRCNRDWLYCIDGDETTWILGPARAQVFTTKRAAQIALARVRKAASKWTKRDGTPETGFAFVLIEDRRHLPHYFASTNAA